jgi:hypothetical protein
MTDPGFPEVSFALAYGTASEEEAGSFLAALAPWHERAMAWLDEQVSSGGISSRLRDLLKWSLGSRTVRAPAVSGYLISRLPPPSGSTVEDALDVLTWRAGVVDFLSDVWDTMGPADFEFEECTLAIEQLFTPPSLRATQICPNCMQPLPADSRTAASHTLECPIRLRREQASGRTTPPELR